MGSFDRPSSPCLMDLLDFNIDETETAAADDIENPNSLPPHPLTECEEYEELEWISNKDVFPSVDTFVPSVETFSDVIPSDTTIVALKHESPVSVLDHSNSSFNGQKSQNLAPIRRPRSKVFKRRQRGGLMHIQRHHLFELCRSIHAKETSGIIGRKCTHCGSEKTPQWRAGPNGAKTLCNACGVRFKSGRLCPEYRPANSPTFSDAVHSNSHRKIVEMRKMKQMSNATINPVDNG